ncbi:MFS transporter [Aerococcaceae bacterium WGS1372]
MAEERLEVHESKLTFKHRIGYGAGDGGGVVTLEFLQMYLNRYVTNVLGISFSTVSILLLIWNIWDMVNDPLMGNFMDRSFIKSNVNKDKFRPWILRSIPVIVFGLIAFFSVPSYLDGTLQVVALFLLKIVYELGYTMMNIAMGSLLSVMATNDTERTTLSSARGLGSVVGAFAMMFTVPLILDNFGENSTGYAVAGIFCAILGGILIFIHYAWTEERNKEAQANIEQQEQVEFKDIFETFKKNRLYLALCIHSIVLVFAQLLRNQTTTYIFADYYGDIGIMSSSSILSTALSVLILIASPKLVELVGSTVNLIRYSLLASSLLSMALFALMITVDVNPYVYLIASTIATNLMMTSILLQWGLVGESIDYNEIVTGKRNEGTLYGNFSLTRRLGNTIAQSIVVLSIGWIGYNQAAANSGAAQSDGTIFGLLVLNLIGPAIGAFLSYLSFTFIWKIDDETKAKIED